MGCTCLPSSAAGQLHHLGLATYEDQQSFAQMGMCPESQHPGGSGWGLGLGPGLVPIFLRCTSRKHRDSREPSWKPAPPPWGREEQTHLGSSLGGTDKWLGPGAHADAYVGQAGREGTKLAALLATTLHLKHGGCLNFSRTFAENEFPLSSVALETSSSHLPLSPPHFNRNTSLSS